MANIKQSSAMNNDQRQNQSRGPTSSSGSSSSRHQQRVMSCRPTCSLVLVSAALLLCGLPTRHTSVEGFILNGAARQHLRITNVDRASLESSQLRLDLATATAARRRPRQDGACRTGSASALSATKENESTSASSSDSWSNSGGNGGRNESRLRVRSRVKSVLAKARNRTGIKNSSEEGGSGSSYSVSGRVVGSNSGGVKKTKSRIKTELTAADVVADAASIGGLGAVVVDDAGTVDVALDYVPKVSSRAAAAATSSRVPKAKATSSGTAAASSSPSGSRSGVDANGKAAQQKQQQQAEMAKTSSAAQQKKKMSPASTYSDPVTPPLRPNPEDSLVPGGSTTTAVSEVDAFRGDVSAAFSMPPPPLPFTLPDLTAEQQRQLDNGERVQFQNDMGREGSGFVVLDVKAPPDVVWDCLLDFHSYPETIPTVRDVTMYTNTHLTDDYRSERPVAFEDGTMATLKHGIPSVTRASFSLSKFKLKIAAIHKYRPHPLGDYMVFTLDPACTNMVLKAAKGVWHTQSNPDEKGEEYTRVWLLCEVKVSRLLPQWITDYAARRAMPRATTWLKPQVEAASALWLNKREG